MKQTAESRTGPSIFLLTTGITFILLIPAVASTEKTSLTDKTLVVWVSLANLTQRGGSALTVNDTTIDRFDGVVFAELENSVWMPGSNNYSRTHKEQSDWPKETAALGEFVQIAIVYKGKEVTVYHNGKLYAKYIMPSVPYTFGPQTAILFGQRHLGNNDHFFGRIKDARVYAQPLDQATIAAMEAGKPAPGVEPWAWWDFTEVFIRQGSLKPNERSVVVTIMETNVCLDDNPRFFMGAEYRRHAQHKTNDHCQSNFEKVARFH